MANEADRDFVEFIIKGIVNNPDDVKVDRKIDEMGVLLTLSVNPEDMGQVIGRQGSVARAIRTLLRVIGVKNNARINFRIEEPEGGRRSPEGASEPEEKKEDAPKNVDEVVDDLNL